MKDMQDRASKARILVWDVPTRVFHWLLVGSIGGAFLTADSERLRDLHVLLGYTAGGLIGFRLAWGVIGTRYARFRSFLFGPAEVVRYLRSLATRAPRHYLGHNPLGSLAVFALLALVLLAAVTGHATFNDVGGEWAEELHEGVAFVILALVVVHVAGVLVSSLLHRENLVAAMITGRKRGEPAQGIRRSHAWLAVVMLGGVMALWYWYPSMRPPQAEAARVHRVAGGG